MSHHQPPRRLPRTTSAAYEIMRATDDTTGGYVNLIVTTERRGREGVLHTTRVVTDDPALLDALVPGATLKIEVVAPEEETSK